MTGILYLAALLLSIGGMAVIDRRWHLAFWHDARRAGLTVGIGVLGFLLWDVAGLLLGIFSRGESPWMTGILLAPDLPIEEVFFLTLLSYVGLVVWRAAEVLLGQRETARSRGDDERGEQ
ncbi:lycopene cyclase domain-containing protein [Cellulosimicrobium terreum]|nr:lycopene cyclase domain-containing protein [Cellulosimicrobium terreum]